VTDTDQRPDRVLVVGDANPDLVLRGDVLPRFGQAEQLLDDASLVIGGSAAIVAHGLARLRRPVSLLAAVGDDLFGGHLADELAESDVDIRFLLVRKESRTGITVVLSRPDDRAIFTLPGTIPTLTQDEVTHAVTESGAAHVHIASLFLQPDLATRLPGVLAGLRAAGVTTSLDTNADPAGRWQGVTELLPHLDVLLPNLSEVCALGGEDDPHRAAARLAAAGPLVVVKDGAQGGFAVRPDGQSVRAAGHPVEVVDTTGAGDTFDAAFLDSWLAGTDLQSCLDRAVRAGAFSVAAPGGTASQPYHHDLPTRPATHREDQ
jgi:sugar/nucleoside kinase (ribokinase family)